MKTSTFPTVTAQTPIAVTVPWIKGAQPSTVAALIVELRRAMLFSDYAVAQLHTWDGAAPLTISIGGEYDITATLA